MDIKIGRFLAKSSVFTLAFIFSTVCFSKGYFALEVGTSDYDVSGVSDEGTAFGVSGGLDVSEFFAVEFVYKDFGEVDFADPSLGSIDADGFGASAVAFLELSEQARVHASAGLFRWDFSSIMPSVGQTSDTGADPFFGIGASLDLDGGLGVTGGYSVFDVGDADLRVLSIGLRFWF